MDQLLEDTPDVLRTDELECKICYSTYSLSSHRQKVLKCCHRLCSECLAKLLDLGESPSNNVVCPFCRYMTDLPGDSIASVPDDTNLMAALSILKSEQLQKDQGEILLSPRCLTSLVGRSASASLSSVCSNYGVVTILGFQEPATAGNYSSSSSDSIASVTHLSTVWNCIMLLCQASAQVLAWFLGMVYFSSLPLGVYLLIMHKTTLGALLLGVVPISLLGVMLYGICQCMCQEFFDCMPP